MKNIHKNQAGIATLALIVVALLIAGVIGYVGWKVGSGQKSDNKTSQDTSQQSEAETTDTPETEATETEETVNTTANWLSYQASGYKIKFADGWQVMKKQGNNDSLFNIDNNLALVPGKQAVVEAYKSTGQSEYRYMLNIDYYDSSSLPCSADTSMQKAFKTDSGLDVYKYQANGPTEELVAGDKGYYYCIQINNKYVLRAGYTISSDMQNHSEVVESVIKTVQTL